MAPSEQNGGRWILSMGWMDLLFAHWPVPCEVLRPLIPAGLQIDTFDGQAWLGIVPFQMSAVRPRWMPALPSVSAFPELNVRTYVTRDGRPGVWFFSLDAASRLAVRVARATFHLPYFDARMECRACGDGGVEYRSERTHRGVIGARWEARYRPVGPVFRSEPGSLEHWLTERYCLYSTDGAGRVYRGEVHHAPWPLQQAEAEVQQCDMTRILGWSPSSATPAHLLFSRGVTVTACWPQVTAQGP